MKDIYLSFGSNIGNSTQKIKEVFEELSQTQGIYHIEKSRLYRTSPLSPIPQRDYINGVLRFKTPLPCLELFTALQKIETKLGKTPKSKQAPRTIDIDILFFGNDYINTDILEIPHPRWKQRLFVLIPLLDLTETITYPINQDTMETLSIRDFLSNGDWGDQNVYLL